jgi:hypothetical protein
MDVGCEVWRGRPKKGGTGAERENKVKIRERQAVWTQPEALSSVVTYGNSIPGNFKFPSEDKFCQLHQKVRIRYNNLLI